MKQWEIPLEKKSKLVIVSYDELEALGKYDAVTDTVYYIPQIADEEVAGGSLGKQNSMRCGT